MSGLQMGALRQRAFTEHALGHTAAQDGARVAQGAKPLLRVSQMLRARLTQIQAVGQGDFSLEL